MEEKIKKLEAIGGKYWEGGERKRVYFNADAVLHNSGLEVERYNTGRISSAKYNGKEISNSWATEIINKIQYGKIYFDLNTNKVMTSGSYSDHSQEIVDNFVSKIYEAVK